MANIKSAKKRAKTNAKRRLANRQVKSSVRTALKKVLAALDPANPNHSNLLEIYRQFVKTIDTAARKGIINKHTAARKKSRLALKINKIKLQSQSA
ncbi:MAG: 30S ribosomal protein S20 [Spirochaetes bacterium]|nr:30S ribosomal protein S20 [Spirochaetota bacterium]